MGSFSKNFWINLFENIFSFWLFVKANLTGAIITKLDGTSRGGVSLAVASEVNLPIRFIGAGEGIKDLRPFNSYEFVEAMLADK